MNHSLVLVILALPVLAGCSDPYAGTREDLGLLAPAASPATTTSADPEEWLPSLPGRAWAVTTGWRSVIDGLSSGERTERVTAQRGSDGRVGWLAFGRDESPTREEWMVDLPIGRCLERTVAGPERLSLEPPMPIVPRKWERGRSIPWSGILRTRTESLSARGWTRYRGMEWIDWKGKQVEAACIETVVVAHGGIGEVRLPTRRWLVRGFGPARVWFQVGNSEYVRESTDFPGD